MCTRAECDVFHYTETTHQLPRSLFFAHKDYGQKQERQNARMHAHTLIRIRTRSSRAHTAFAEFLHVPVT